MKIKIFQSIVLMIVCLSLFSNNLSLADTAEEESYSLYGDTHPQIAIDGNGNAIIVWNQFDKKTGFTNLLSSHFSASGGWSSPLKVDLLVSMVSGMPLFAIDAGGSESSVLPEWKSKSTYLWVNRHKFANRWVIPTAKFLGGKSNDNKKYSFWLKSVIADRKGNSYIQWGKNKLVEMENEMDGSKYMGVVKSNLYINRLDAIDGKDETIFSMEVNERENCCEMAVDGYGNFFLMRMRKYAADKSGERLRIEVSRYDLKRNWGAPVTVNSDEMVYSSSNTFEFIHPTIAIDGEGNAISVWQQSGNIYSNRFEYKSNTWGKSLPIEPRVYGGPEIAANKGGDLFAVWNAMEGRNNSKILVKNYVAGQGWKPLNLINDADAASDRMQLAVDSRGNAVVVWRQYGGQSYSVWANRYNVDKGWEKSEMIDVNEVTEAWDPQVAFDGLENAIVVWSKLVEKNNVIYANRYIPEKGWLGPKLISRKVK